jgi:DNA adenine methylase
MLIGNKNNKDLYRNLLEKLIPSDIKIYVEPFGGEFGLYEIIDNKPHLAIYNDINIELYQQVKEKHEYIVCHNQDYIDIILQYDSKDTFFFVDPPYLDREHYYKNHNFIRKENHKELSKILTNIKGKFLLSYQDKEYIRELYDGFNFYKYTGHNMFHKPEIAITNY